MILGPDGNVWFSETEVSQIGRITPNGDITEFKDGISPGARPLSIMVRDGMLWFSEASGNRIGRITTDGKVTEFPIPSHDSQPRAMVTHPDGSIWFVETSTNALGRIDRDGRITEHPVPTPNSSLRGVTVGRDNNLWYTANAANKIGCMTPDGDVLGEFPIPTPASGARCIAVDVGRPAVLHAMGRRPDRRGEGALKSAQETKSGRNVMTGILRALVCVAFAVAASTAHAQTYPDKPIQMIVSIAAGSVTDVIMRAAANELQPRLKQTLVIENQGGAAGILGGQACARAAPDGYTICVIYHSTMSYNPLLFTKLPYNPDTDFAPIARLFFLTEGVFASTALGVNSVAELKAKAQSGAALNYATLGEGSFPDLFLKWMNNQWNTKIVGIPYRGGGPAAQALAANDVQVTRFGVGNFTGLLEGGKVKALAVGLPTRSPLLPDVPTLDEAGLPGFPARAGGDSPRRVARRRRSSSGSTASSSKLFSEPKFKAFLDKQAVASAPTTPAGLRRVPEGGSQGGRRR